eukprot:3413441-Amphidinium_carterae.1
MTRCYVTAYECRLPSAKHSNSKLTPDASSSKRNCSAPRACCKFAAPQATTKPANRVTRSHIKKSVESHQRAYEYSLLAHLCPLCSQWREVPTVTVGTT